MIECPFCHNTQVDNTIFCDECGTYLVKEDSRETDPLDSDELDQITGLSSDPALSRRSRPPTLRLKIGPHKRRLEIPLDKTIRLGRVDPTIDEFPEVDLTADGSWAKRVSRRHVRITSRGGVALVEDLASFNGTFLNDVRLSPYLPETLRSGDILRLGLLEIEVEIVR